MSDYQILLVIAIINDTIFTTEATEAQIAEAVWQDVKCRKAFKKLEPLLVKTYIKVLIDYCLLSPLNEAAHGKTKV